MKVPRFLYIEQARFIGEDDTPPMILVEEEPGRFRRAKGADLTELHARYPYFLRRFRNGPDPDWG